MLYVATPARTRRMLGASPIAHRLALATVLALLVLPFAELTLGVSGSPTFLLEVLVIAGGWGMALSLWVARRRAEAAERAHIAAATCEARRRVVRDLHDGAQQHIVHTIVMLELARQAIADDEVSAPALVGEAVEQARAANDELRALANGMSPPALTRGGLTAGIDALVEHSPVPVAVDVCAARLSPGLESAAYFVIAEALTNITKHARACSASVRVWLDGGTVHIEVCDDGVGGADPTGAGLVGLRCRVRELGGELSIVSSPSSGTRLTAGIPFAT